MKQEANELRKRSVYSLDTQWVLGESAG